VVVSGGNLLTRLPLLLLSSSCFASSRLCAANISSGDIAGGTSPAKCCILGDGAARGDGKPMVFIPSEEFERRSIKVGRDMVEETRRDPG